MISYGSPECGHLSTGVDKYLGAKYVPNKYTCHNFADDVWRDLTGKSLDKRMIEFLDKGKTYPGMRKSFIRLQKPIGPCIALFKPLVGRDNHVGIYLRGRILHLAEMGVKFQSLDTAIVGYRELRFYACP